MDTQLVAVILWSFMSQRGCYEPALPIVDGLLDAGHRVVGFTQGADRVVLPWGIEVVSDHFLPPPPGLPDVSGPPGDLEAALAGKILLAGWHASEVERLIAEHEVDLVLADGFRLGAGFGAERAGVPWVAYTHHYFDEAGTSEGMVEYYCGRFGRPTEAPEVFARWWPVLVEALGGDFPVPGSSDPCWWNLSGSATLVLGLPELKVHARPAPSFVHRIGPTLWQPPQAVLPDSLARLGRERPAVLVAMSTNPLGDEALAETAQLLAVDLDVVLTAGQRPLPDSLAGLLGAGDVAHGLLMDRVAAVVCSGGHGTVTRAACAGVPVVAVPRMGDQFLVADAVATSGLGRQVDATEPPATVAQACLAVLRGDRSVAEGMARGADPVSSIRKAVGLIEGMASP